MKSKHYLTTLTVIGLCLGAGSACSRRKLSADQYRDLAQSESVKGNYKKSNKYLDRALEKTFDEELRGKILCEIGLNYYQLGNYREAVQALEEGLESVSAYPAAHGVLGLSYYNVNPFRYRDQVRSHLNAYIEQKPDNPIVPGMKNILFELDMMEKQYRQQVGVLAEPTPYASPTETSGDD